MGSEMCIRDSTCTNACAAVHPSLHDTGTNSVPTHVPLYDTYCCTHPLLCTCSASGGRGEAWRGKNRHTGPALALSAIPSPVSGTMVPRFFCCTPVVLLSYTHCEFVGCWMFFSAVCCAVLLLYYGPCSQKICNIFSAPRYPHLLVARCVW